MTGAPKKSLVEFVPKVTKENGPDVFPPAERTAVFDYDGMLWAEQPMYVQLLFALDRVKPLEPQHPILTFLKACAETGFLLDPGDCHF